MTPARIFFATPCYRSSTTAAVEWAKSTAALLGLGESAKCSVTYCAWIDVARSQLVGAFRNSECTHMLMRDDDVCASADTLERMIATDAPMVVAPYKVRGADRFDAVLDSSGEVEHSGLGCALVRADVIEALWARHFGDLSFVQDGQTLVNLFDRIYVQRDDGRQIYKEDRAFCWRVRGAGFSIRALPGAIVDHAGTLSTYPG